MLLVLSILEKDLSASSNCVAQNVRIIEKALHKVKALEKEEQR
jgi:chitinase